MDRSMTRRTTAAVIALTLPFLLSGCDTPDASEVLLQGPHLTIVSEQRHFANWATGGQTNYRVVRVKVNGRTVADADLSLPLFPADHPCHSPFYAIHDLRMLPNESALVLMTQNDRLCGQAQLARLSVVEGRLKVERMDVSRVVSARGAVSRGQARGVDSETFGDADGDGVSRPDALRNVRATWTSVTQRVATAEEAPHHAVAIDLSSLHLSDLGPGDVLRFVDTSPVALVLFDGGGDPAHRRVQFRAVNAVNGQELDQVTIAPACYSLNARAARILGEADIANGSPEELMSDHESGDEAQQRHASAIANALAGLYDVKPTIAWRPTERRLRVDLDGLLVRRPHCDA
ncbi:hypothetical protein C404_06720 [Ralstonia sp. AU12-08]|nr:hypothetical protein C404_06720 [Ralstonia sp. AU12-08]